MVEPIVRVTDADRKAGYEYLRALRRLHFDPEVMCWIYEMDGWRELADADQGPPVPTGEKHLAIVSNLVDYAGSKIIYDLLFRAYDAAITPQEIDPFIVHMFSPDSIGGRTLAKGAEDGLLESAKEAESKKRDDVGVVVLGRNFFQEAAVFTMIVPVGGIIVAKRKGIKPEKTEQRFRDFQRTVDSLAA